MKVSSIAYALATLGVTIVESYPGELLYACAPAMKEWEGEYTPWAGLTKNAHAHLTFDDGPFVNITDTILDVLKDYNTSATFFLVSDNLNDDTRYLVDRMIDEGHTIGSHSSTHKNLQYGNETILEQEITHAHHKFKEYLGFQPKLFRPPFGGIDHRSHELLEELGYTIVQWSAGCNDWWFTDNDKDLETSIAALRYTLAEAGGIVCMHDKAEEPNNGERLRKFLDDTWNFWDYVDFNTCINRNDVDEGMVFKTYDEYKRAVDKAAAGGGSAATPDGDDAIESNIGKSKAEKVPNASSKSGKSAKSAKNGKKHHTMHEPVMRRNLR